MTDFLVAALQAALDRCSTFGLKIVDKITSTAKKASEGC
jgi:hypothetical protein